MTPRGTTPEAAADLAHLRANLTAAERACKLADTEASQAEADERYLACHREYHAAKGRAA